MMARIERAEPSEFETQVPLVIVGAGAGGIAAAASLLARVDNLDIESAIQRGITVTNTPGVLTDDTADVTMALILAVPLAQALPTMAATVVGLALAGFVLFVLFIPVPHQNVRRPRVGVAIALRFIAAHPRFRRLLASFALVQTGNAFFSGLAVLYVTFILADPALVGLMIGLLFLATAALLPLWQMLAKRLGKVGTWKVGIVASCVAFALLPLFGAGDTIPIALLFFAIGATFGADAVMPTSILADIAYADEVKENRRQSGLYLSIKNGASKLAFVVPLAVAFPILDLVQFEERAGEDPTVRLTLLLFFAALPIAFKLAALAVLSRGQRSPAGTVEGQPVG